jgi:hypothetical protein
MRTYKSSLNKQILIYFFIPFIAIPQANAFWITAIAKISSSAKALPDNEIIRLSKLSDELIGTTKVGKELGKLNLPQGVLEDTFIRIAIHQGKITRKEAEGMYERLSGVSGFRTTLRKVIGNSPTKTNGHLNELKIADKASSNGFIVLGIGEKFYDRLKKALTDIDIVLQKGGKTYAIEAKSFSSSTRIPMDKYRSDLETLVEYKGKHNNKIITIFSITKAPDDPNYLKLLLYEANKRGVQLITGSSQEQIEQIKLLGEIL